MQSPKWYSKGTIYTIFNLIILAKTYLSLNISINMLSYNKRFEKGR